MQYAPYNIQVPTELKVYMVAVRCIVFHSSKIICSKFLDPFTFFDIKSNLKDHRMHPNAVISIIFSSEWFFLMCKTLTTKQRLSIGFCNISLSICWIIVSTPNRIWLYTTYYRQNWIKMVKNDTLRYRKRTLNSKQCIGKAFYPLARSSANRLCVYERDNPMWRSRKALAGYKAFICFSIAEGFSHLLTFTSVVGVLQRFFAQITWANQVNSSWVVSSPYAVCSCAFCESILFVLGKLIT